MQSRESPFSCDMLEYLLFVLFEFIVFYEVVVIIISLVHSIKDICSILLLFLVKGNKRSTIWKL